MGSLLSGDLRLRLRPRPQPFPIPIYVPITLFVASSHASSTCPLALNRSHRWSSSTPFPYFFNVPSPSSLNASLTPEIRLRPTHKRYCKTPWILDRVRWWHLDTTNVSKVRHGPAIPAMPTPITQRHKSHPTHRPYSFLPCRMASPTLATPFNSDWPLRPYPRYLFNTPRRPARPFRHPSRGQWSFPSPSMSSRNRTTSGCRWRHA